MRHREPGTSRLALAWAIILLGFGVGFALTEPTSGYRFFGLVLSALGAIAFFLYLHVRSETHLLNLNPPRCRICNQPMALHDLRRERWCCDQDGQLFYAQEEKWIEFQPAPKIQPRKTNAGIGDFLETIGLGIGYFLLAVALILAALALLYWMRPFQ